MAKKVYSFLNYEFGLNIITERINGNAFYHLEYGNDKRVISISYENIEDYLQVIIFILDDGKRPNYDDKLHTLHLNTLNKAVFVSISKDQLTLNEEHFADLETENMLERRLLKEAKALRLYLLNES